MKSSVLLIGLIVAIVALSGCLNSRYYSDPLYCESDTDCTEQRPDPGACNCSKPINIYNVEPVNWDAFSDDGPVCKLYCYSTTPRCVENKCILERLEES
ncbi:MAG: hypothetical protein JW772_01730 [Candidatus Diapherotrites archaeon]|nr:hypothetical protein [Candidatus Diapherotrites archaeon]